MKFPLLLGFAALMVQPAFSAVTVERGSLIPSAIVDSEGNALDGSFTFQLGFFQDSFTPTVGNTADWATYWEVFDQADYNTEVGYFTGSAGVNGDGTSTSTFASPTISFTNEQAYIWVFNSQTPGTSTEWFLATDPSWVFPVGNDDCCDPSPPLQWSLSDLDNGDVAPVWGAQTDQTGAGDYSVTNPLFDLQTFVIVPEPGSLMLVVITACGFTLRRKRRAACTN